MHLPRPQSHLLTLAIVVLGFLMSWAPAPAAAQIIHRVITPPAQVGLPAPNGRITPVDVDDDGAPDLVIRVYDNFEDVYPDGFGYILASDATLLDVVAPDAGVLAWYGDYGDRYWDSVARIYALGQFIQPQVEFHPVQTSVVCGRDEYGLGLPFNQCGFEPGYLGFTFPIGASLHYGWLRSDFGSATEPRIELAYEATPGRAITAGATQTPCPPVIISQPSAPGNNVLNTDVLFLYAQVLTVPGATYQWTRDGVPIGRNEPTLFDLSPGADDTGRYVLTVTSPCGSVSTEPFPVRVPSTCNPDAPLPPSSPVLSLNGQNAALAAPHAADLNAFPITFEAWVECTGVGIPGIINKYRSSSRNGFNLYVYNGEVRAWYFRDFDNFVWNVEGSGLGMNGGRIVGSGWHHVAATFDLSGGKLYVDGVLRDSRPWTGQPGPCTTAEPLSIGFYPSPDNRGYLQGSIDEVRIWNYARTAEQIAGAKDRTIDPAEPGLLAYYTFEQGVFPVPDLSGRAHDAAPVGGPSFRTVQACCRADYNDDGRQDPDDLADFIQGYFASPPHLATDVNQDGAFDPDDLSDFITLYFQGC